MMSPIKFVSMLPVPQSPSPTISTQPQSPTHSWIPSENELFFRERIPDDIDNEFFSLKVVNDHLVEERRKAKKVPYKVPVAIQELRSKIAPPLKDVLAFDGTFNPNIEYIEDPEEWLWYYEELKNKRKRDISKSYSFLAKENKGFLW